MISGNEEDKEYKNSFNCPKVDNLYKTRHGQLQAPKNEKEKAKKKRKDQKKSRKRNRK